MNTGSSCITACVGHLTLDFWVVACNCFADADKPFHGEIDSLTNTYQSSQRVLRTNCLLPCIDQRSYLSQRTASNQGYFL